MEIKLNISKIIVAYLVAIWALITPVHGFFIIIILAVVIDTATGIAASVKKGGWRSLSSSNFFNVAVKLFFYLSVIFLFYMIGKHVFHGELFGISFPLTKATTMIFLYIEGKSFDENQKVFSGKSLSTWLHEIYKNLKKLKRDFNDLSKD